MPAWIRTRDIGEAGEPLLSGPAGTRCAAERAGQLTPETETGHPSATCSIPPILREDMLVEVVDDYGALSDRAAEVLIEQIREQPDSTIGFATGGTPKGLYNRLIKAHEERGLDFSKLTTFNLDEYVGLPPGDRKSVV